MDRINWYFKQPVTDDDMNFQTAAVEKVLHAIAADGQNPFGVAVGDYVVMPGTGLSVFVNPGNAVAWNKLGRRIQPATFVPWTQSIATATDGSGSTAVTGAGNERWISLFVRSGRRFTDPETDGLGNSVRKTAWDNMNALGDAPVVGGAYDPVAAHEAGVNLLYILPGLENTIGQALRATGTMDDGVLVADVRLVYGQTTLTQNDIYFDRRQVLTPPRLYQIQGEKDRYAAADGTPNFGPTSEAVVAGSTGSWYLTVSNARGYVQDVTNFNDLAVVRYNLPAFTPPYQVRVDPPDTNARIDTLTVNTYNELRVIKGTPSGSPAPAAVPAGQVAIARVKSVPGSTDTHQWLSARVGRRLPFPYSESTGILEGCEIRWLNRFVFGALIAQPYVYTKRNRIVWQGECWEFGGGLGTDGNPLFPVTTDMSNAPFGGAAGTITPYYIYACKNSFQVNGTSTSSVMLVQSTTAPDSTNVHSFSALNTAERGLIPAADTMLVGVGWANGAYAVPYTTYGNWYMPLQAIADTIAIGIGSEATVTIAGAHQTSVCKMCRVLITASETTGPMTITFVAYDLIGMGTMLKQISLPAVTVPALLTIGEYELPLSSGLIRVNGTGGAFLNMWSTAFHIDLPRISSGRG